MANSPNKVRSLDGFERTAEREKELNELMAVVFGTPSGKAALAYLRSISIDTAAGPGVEPNRLLHIEGQRFIVGLITQRVEAGHKARAAVTEKK